MQQEVYNKPIYIHYNSVGGIDLVVSNGSLHHYDMGQFDLQVTLTPKSEDPIPAAGWYAWSDDTNSIDYYSGEEFADSALYRLRVQRGDIYRVEVSGLHQEPVNDL